MARWIRILFVLMVMGIWGAGARGADVEIRGEIVGADEKPAGGAQVYLVRREEGKFTQMGSVVCDADGRFSVSAKEEPEEIFAVIRGVGISAPVKPGEPMLQLQLLPAVDAGLTLIGPDGKPAQGVEAHAGMILIGDFTQGMPSFLLLEGDFSGLFSATTDAQGKCVLKGLPRGARVRFDTSDERFAHVSRQPTDVLDGEGAVVQIPEMVLQKGATVTGRLVAPDTGKPVAGLGVGSQGSHGNMSGGGGARDVTDADGKFTLKRMGGGNFVVSLQEIGDKPNEWVAAAVDVNLEPGGTQVVNMVLERGNLLKGQVVDRVTRKGIAGATVGLYGPSKPDYAASIYARHTDGDGRFEFRVPAGMQHPYLASAVPDGYEVPSGQGRMDVMVKDGGTEEVTIELSPDTSPPVTGVVLGPDGSPVAGATVTAEDPNGDMFTQKMVTTDAHGRYAIHGKAGTLLRAHWKSMGTDYPENAVAGQEVELRLDTNPTFTIIAEVLDEEGNPVAGAKASLMVTNGHFGVGGQPKKADAQGIVRFEGLAMDRKYEVEATAPGYGVANGKVTHVPVGGPREVTTSVRLAKSDAKIAGVVVDGAGKALAGVGVEINSSQTGVQETKTDAQGMFSFQVMSSAQPLIWVRTDKGLNVGTTRVIAGDEAVKIVFTDEKAKIEVSLHKPSLP